MFLSDFPPIFSPLFQHFWHEIDPFSTAWYPHGPWHLPSAVASIASIAVCSASRALRGSRHRRRARHSAAAARENATQREAAFGWRVFRRTWGKNMETMKNWRSFINFRQSWVAFPYIFWDFWRKIKVLYICFSYQINKRLGHWSLLGLFLFKIGAMHDGDNCLGLFCHGSLNVPIEHHPTIRYMVYFMATFSADVQYSQNGTVTNPWISSLVGNWIVQNSWDLWMFIPLKLIF